MLNRIGWLGSALLAICGLPLFVSAFNNRKYMDIWEIVFLLVWLFGEIITLVAVLLKDKHKSFRFLQVNYILNIVFILGILILKRI